MGGHRVDGGSGVHSRIDHVRLCRWRRSHRGKQHPMGRHDRQNPEQHAVHVDGGAGYGYSGGSPEARPVLRGSPAQSDGVVGKHLHFGDRSPKRGCAVVHAAFLRVLGQHLLGHVGGAGMGTAVKTLFYGTLGFLAFGTFVEPKQMEAMFTIAAVHCRYRFWGKA